MFGDSPLKYRMVQFEIRKACVFWVNMTSPDITNSLVFDPSFLRQLERFRLKSKRQFYGSHQGGHTSLRRGYGSEFADYRKYSPGDNPRQIDWNVLARTDRVFVKQYQEELNLPIAIAIDTSKSMAPTGIQDPKWIRSCKIAAAISYVALMQHEIVSIYPLGNHQPLTLRGAHSFQSMVTKLADIVPSGDSQDVALQCRNLAIRLKHPGKAIVISDFLFSLEKVDSAFRALRSKNLDIAAIQLLSNSDIHPYLLSQNAVLIDSETDAELEVRWTPEQITAYSKNLESHQASIIKTLRGGDISFCSTTVDEGLEQFCFQKLTEIGLFQ